MNTKNKNLAHVIKLCECAILIALAVVLDYLSKFIFAFLEPLWVFGGGITLCMVPIVFIAYRHGSLYGILSALVYSGIQFLDGGFANVQYLISLNTPVFEIIACILFDYLLAYTVLGCSGFFAKLFKRKLLGYGSGAFIVCFLRFICSFLSGAIVWKSLGNFIGIEFTNVWAFSFVYNATYLIPNAIITTVITVAICAVFNPKTLKRYAKTENNT